VPLSPSSLIGIRIKRRCWSAAAESRAWGKLMTAYRRVYGFGHLRADCRGLGSALLIRAQGSAEP